MKSLGEDWFSVGEVYFRFLHLYDMPWGTGFSFRQFKVAIGENCGYIAMLLDAQAGCKPVLQIFTASGRLVSQQLWKDSPPVALCWSNSEELLVVQKSGFVSISDLSGNYVRRFSMGSEAEEREILDARFFLLHTHTGVAVLTTGNQIFVASSIETPRIRRVAHFSGPVQPISLWEIVTTPLDISGRAGSNPDDFQPPWVLFSRKRSIFRADFNTMENVDLPALSQFAHSEIKLMKVSSNMKFVSIYFDNGILLVTNLRMSEIHSQVDLTQRVSVMLLSPETDVRSQSAEKLSHPRTMLWCTSSAVVLQWDHVLALIGAHGDIYESFFADDIYLTFELDSVRILTPTAHKLLQRVPPALEALGRIGASCPATWLVSANASLKAGSGRANDYLLPIQSSRQMLEGISHCLEAASHAVLDTECQQSLLEAAHMGLIFLSALFTDSNDQPVEGELEKLGDHAARVCRWLRLLNNLAVPWIGLALTWFQFQKLGPKKLLERLLARKHYPMAVEFVRTMPKSVPPQAPQTSGKAIPSVDELTINLTRVLAHWACYSTVASSEDSALISEHLAQIVSTILSTNTRHKGDSSGACRTVDFAEVANQALAASREKVAEQLLEYEARAWHQVPLLLKLGRYKRALVKAVETGNPELITVVVVALQDKAKLPPADLAMVLRKHPMAMAIYHETFGRGSNVGDNDLSSAIVNFDQEDDRASEARKAIVAAYKETNLQLRLNSMQRAEEIYKQLKNEFMSQECSAAIRLLRFQSKLEKQEVRAPVLEFLAACASADVNFPSESPLILPSVVPSGVEEKQWVGQPLNTTLARLLATPQLERYADQLRREFRVSEKRYAHLRLIGLAIQNDCLPEVEKLAKLKKPPVSIETLTRVCIDCNHFEEAQKLIPRLPPERRVRFLLHCGQLEEAIAVAAREKSDTDLCLIWDRVGKDNRTVRDRIALLRQQIRT
ncbi:unnamed protein product [Dicrocoelium dendriticum]|nr:unnamed protein product [Dicrocoelium dendriticum]